MKKLTLLIILITSIVKAQTEFDFGCGLTYGSQGSSYIVNDVLTQTYNWYNPDYTTHKISTSSETIISLPEGEWNREDYSPAHSCCPWGDEAGWYHGITLIVSSEDTYTFGNYQFIDSITGLYEMSYQTVIGGGPYDIQVNGKDIVPVYRDSTPYVYWIYIDTDNDDSTYEIRVRKVTQAPVSYHAEINRGVFGWIPIENIDEI